MPLRLRCHIGACVPSLGSCADCSCTHRTASDVAQSFRAAPEGETGCYVQDVWCGVRGGSASSQGREALEQWCLTLGAKLLGPHKPAMIDLQAPKSDLYAELEGEQAMVTTVWLI